jgi:hypothetical protein
MPMDMAGLAGTIGGIAELAKSALGNDPSSPRGAVPPSRTKRSDSE